MGFDLFGLWEACCFVLACIVWFMGSMLFCVGLYSLWV